MFIVFLLCFILLETFVLYLTLTYSVFYFDLILHLLYFLLQCMHIETLCGVA